MPDLSQGAIVNFSFTLQMFGIYWLSSNGVFVIAQAICEYAKRRVSFWGFGGCEFIDEALATCLDHRKILFVYPSIIRRGLVNFMSHLRLMKI